MEWLEEEDGSDLDGGLSPSEEDLAVKEGRRSKTYERTGKLLGLSSVAIVVKLARQVTIVEGRKEKMMK